ncbi:MAG: hypothetical protein SVR94_00230 [Pseudomonadota bacterium]|nr:hypothetical protein [Pseudomonadota bacterium]
MKIDFLIIDPQNDFAHPSGQLFVPGAEEDGQRLREVLKRYLPKINKIHLTLDTHHPVHIAHPIFWIDPHGQHPQPFTVITAQAINQQHWQTYRPDFQKRASDYVDALEAHGRYQLTIWPPHCLIGSFGHNIVAPVAEVIREWEHNFAVTDYIVKGANIWTEHYSALQADVPDPDDPSTQLNTRLLKALEQADVVICSGQALSHCVANTLRDIVTHIPQADKFILLEDTTSAVAGFEAIGQQFLEEMRAHGMCIAKSTASLI